MRFSEEWTAPPGARPRAVTLVRHAAVGMALVGAAGCARVAPPPSSPPTADDALGRMHATLAQCGGVQANAKIDRFGDDGRVRGDLMLFAARPARIRLDAVSPFGVALATLTSDGRVFAFADLRKKTYYVGPASACNIARLTSVPVPAHVLVDLLRGEAPVLRHVPAETRIAWSTQGYWLVDIASSREARQEIRLAPRPDDWSKPWQEQRMRVLDVRVVQQGYVLYHAELGDHAPAPMAEPRVDPDHLEPPLPPSGPPCDAEIPHRIHVEVPVPKSDIRFQYTQLSWNPPLPSGVFEQSPPSGMSVEEVHCDE
jgi:hypothetical protein